MTTPKFKRHPIKNFFIMTRIQMNHIVRVASMVILVAFLSLGIVGLMYYIRFKTGYLYFRGNDIDAALVRYSIWGIMLPSLLPTFFMAVSLGVAIALYSSRKIALPLFKMRKWAEDLFAGNLKHTVYVRKSDDMHELSTTCNQVSRKYLQILQSMDEITEAEDKNSDEKLAEIKSYLSTLQIK
ncbi:MAG: hypothetical protein HQK83_10465 [Fibrobacteria bacterium]|nr:hypothetical protein [Fibrobacteria bacterium]